MSKGNLPTAKAVFREIEDITGYLVTKGLVDDQNLPVKTTIAKNTLEVTYPLSSIARSATLTDQPYGETYKEQLDARAFNFRMLDGALVQMSYIFAEKTLATARLAFLPSPDLSEYQNDPELYELDVMFAEVIDRRVATVPLRFDFDPANHVDVHHPKSHLTLGMYKNCRIAAAAAPTPGLFIDFILRSFYNTALRTHSEGLPQRDHRFGPSITVNEQRVVYIGIPPAADTLSPPTAPRAHRRCPRRCCAPKQVNVHRPELTRASKSDHTVTTPNSGHRRSGGLDEPFARRALWVRSGCERLRAGCSM